eukprot:595671_1
MRAFRLIKKEYLRRKKSSTMNEMTDSKEEHGSQAKAHNRRKIASKMTDTQYRKLNGMGSGVMNDTMGCGMGRGGIMRNGKMAGDMITGGGMMSGGALKNAGPPANKANGVASSQYDANGMGQPPHQTVFNVSNQTLNQIQGQNRPHRLLFEANQRNAAAIPSPNMDIQASAMADTNHQENHEFQFDFMDLVDDFDESHPDGGVFDVYNPLTTVDDQARYSKNHSIPSPTQIDYDSNGDFFIFSKVMSQLLFYFFFHFIFSYIYM